MKIKVVGTKEIKTDNERVELEVLEDCSLEYYIISDTTYTSEDKISNKLRHIYWFAQQKVSKGDKVTLYTKKGVNSKSIVRSGGMHYVYYWGLDHAVWNNDGDAAVLFQVNNWRTTKAL